MGLIVVIVVIALVFAFVIAQQQARRSNAGPPHPCGGVVGAPGGGSMGRPGEPMPPNQAAQAIYGKLKSQGGISPGRVYSASYFQDVMPYPAYSFNQDPYYWQAVFAALNDLMYADSLMFPASPYMYGGQPAFFFGAYDDPMLNPVFYGDPYATAGVPFDLDPSAFVPNDFGQNDPNFDPGQVDPSQDPINFDQQDNNDGGFFDAGDSGGTGDFGGFDSGDSGGFDSGGDS